MTARQEVYKNGIGLVCRYSGIQMRLEAVVRKIASLQEFIAKNCSEAAVTAATCRNKSGSQCVFEIIQKSETGVDPLTIKQTTGFKEQKIAKILYKLFKYGEIRIEPGGLYVAVAGR
jgi:hypothetical protein